MGVDQAHYRLLVAAAAFAASALSLPLAPMMLALTIGIYAAIGDILVPPHRAPHGPRPPPLASRSSTRWGMPEGSSAPSSWG
ncbi:MAG: hypothetical protein WBW08_02570 [Methyloceanibacter sp.]